MKTLLEKSGILFNGGEALSSSKLNSIIEKENEIIDTINNILKSFCDINQETGLQRVYSLEQAIAIVPVNRRSFTMKIRFIENADTDNNNNLINIRFAEYFYTGPMGFTNDDWINPENWSKNVPNIIDGGEWE